MQEPSAEPGSFRDPLSRVFLDGDEVLRGLRGAGVDDFDQLESTGMLESAVRGGRLVSTERAEPGRLGEKWEVVLIHERLPFISYPYEWTFSMLRDAARLQLQLTLDALEHGMLTKDSTPYNVQFRGASPVFIDVGSFERLDPGTPWIGYRQFCEQFLNPLLLQSLAGVPFQPWLRGAMRGISPGELASLLPRRHKVKPSVLTHVAMHARAESRNADSQRDVRSELKAAGFAPALIGAQLRKLLKIVDRLEWRAASSTWSDYSTRPHYADDDLRAKETFVDEVVHQHKRGTVLDLGANDGRFSRIAAQNSKYVIAVDGDQLVAERLYRELSAEGNDQIVPLVMDLIDSSPSQGWRGRERPSFWSRAEPDLVLALALVHHLALPGNVPIPEIVDWLASTGAEVVLEVPHRDDPMVARLLRAKQVGLRESYHLEEFDTEVKRRFHVLRTQRLPGGTRTLHHLEPLH